MLKSYICDQWDNMPNISMPDPGAYVFKNYTIAPRKYSALDAGEWHTTVSSKHAFDVSTIID